MSNYKFRYCNQCAKANDLEITEVKPVKGECEICRTRIDFLNEVDVEKNDYTKIQAGSFKIVQLDNFVPGIPAKSVHPNLPYRTMAPDMAMYFPSIDDGDGKKSIIIANPITGEHIQIFWDESNFKKTLVGRVNATGGALIPA